MGSAELDIFILALFSEWLILSLVVVSIQKKFKM